MYNLLQHCATCTRAKQEFVRLLHYSIQLSMFLEIFSSNPKTF